MYPVRMRLGLAAFRLFLLLASACLGRVPGGNDSLWAEEASDRAIESRGNPVHWSFVGPARVELPAVKRSGWVRTPIDRFILARLEKEGFEPSHEADRVTLIRRLSLDLTGLLPSVEEVDRFVGDARPDAYERLVERLLASPHYGERWGRHWLDVARYADSNGYSIDAPRSIWKYRDWVIAALNRDVPFDQFVIEQLAGDLLPNATLDQKVATGFHRNTQINQEGGIDPEQFRVESVMDRVNTTSTAFLGLTIACAQCHDHKFDPITQREYYQLFAFFNNTIEDGHGKGAPDGMLEIPGQTEPLDLSEVEEASADLERYLNTHGSKLAKFEPTLSAEEKGKLAVEVREILAIPFSDRTLKQKRIVYGALRGEDKDFDQREKKVRRLESQKAKPITTLVMVERDQPRESVIFIKGDFTRRGPAVEPGVPAVLPGLKRGGLADGGPAAASKGDEGRIGNRLDLARWIVDRRNPLTARVTVNRVWQQYFGRGLVETENDFGTQGTPPSHPELLDWLALQFMEPSLVEGGMAGEQGKAWSLKHVHRLIVSSATYRQASRARPELAAADPYNRWLGRQVRVRLDAEIIRDVGLSAAGLLTRQVGGPSVFPPQPDGVMSLGQVRRKWTAAKGPERYRRGMYTFFWRATPHPTLMVFDSADGFSTCTRRVRSNTPLQGLTLLNDEAFHENAQALALRVLADAGPDDQARLQRLFRLCAGRRADEEEQNRLLGLLSSELAAFERAPLEAEALVEPLGAGHPDRKRLAAWVSVARVVLNLDETITRE